MGERLTQAELEAAHCWDLNDRVPGRPEMTELRRRLRLHQARWRESRGLPMGSQPIVPREGAPSRDVGSRLPLDHARASGANFLTTGALDAVTRRTSRKEARQSLDAQRLWADLLSSVALSFNLFGDLAADLWRADRAVHTWWPDVRGTVREVRFAHSPGRLDLAYTGSLVALDVAFVLDLGDGTQGVLAVQTRYHDRIKPETPKPIRAAHYAGIAERSGAFRPEAVESLNRRSDLLETWLAHLLVLSMLQHPSGRWRWGRSVLVYPAANTDFANGGARYRELLGDPATFDTATIEDVLDARALPTPTVAALRERYLPT